jgi:sulfur carrier protein
MITLSLNNQAKTLPDIMNLSAALEHWQMTGKLFATAINGEFVPRSQYDHINLNDGDTIDIVKPVGGG